MPDSIIVTSDEYRRQLLTIARTLPSSTVVPGLSSSTPSAHDLECVRAAIASVPTDTVFATTLNELLRNAAFSVDDMYAVRSSASSEDMNVASFAGLYESFIGVRQTDLITAIKQCWASLWTDRAVLFRERNGIPHDSAYMSVIIQPLITSDYSGVLFTTNPITKAPDELIIEASWGLGPLIVEGRITPDYYRISAGPSPRIGLEKRIASKRKMLRPDKALKKLTEIEVPKELVRQQCVPDSILLQLVNIALGLKANYGYDLDIEWAVVNDVIYILQARPVTA